MIMAHNISRPDFSVSRVYGLGFRLWACQRGREPPVQAPDALLLKDFGQAACRAPGQSCLVETHS